MAGKRILLVLGVLLSGCGDDSNPARTDRGRSHDALAIDQGLARKDSRLEASAKPSEAGAAWDCKQVTGCQMSCAMDLGCLAACSAKGCASAGAANVKLWDCAIKNCGVECGSSNAQVCEQCLVAKCGLEILGCWDQKC